jgi:dephospho-CoA kinase
MRRMSIPPVTPAESPPVPSRIAPLLIALTGGIASGKSAVANLFAELGVPVLDTDQIARDVVEPGQPALAQLVAEFGADILEASGRLNRQVVRQRVFADPQQRARLEAITHPAIRAELAQRAAAAIGPYQIHVIPLLVETGRAHQYPRVLVVDCPAEIQLQRLMARDGSSAADAQRILQAQATRQQRLDAAHDVIVNTGTVDDLRQFVLTLHDNYRLLAQRLQSPAAVEKS